MAERVILRDLDTPDIDRIAVYEAHGGYKALEKALTEYQPQEVIDIVKRSGLRGRGGAGFPAGVKWGFVPKGVFPRYLICNADESEPGTFKDRQIMEGNPHQLLEGIIISSYAIEAETAYIYIRGEMASVARKLEQAIAESEQHGYLGQNILGSDYSLNILVHRGAGAYICGEETALLESVEGKIGQPRLKPPFPASVGLYAKPTVVNNVETLACVPPILERGPEWFASIGTERSTGPKVFCLSGHVKRPGNYELPMGTTFRELIYEHGGGVRHDKGIKAIMPAGASAPMLTAEHLDVAMDFESVMQAGSMLGSGSVIVMDESTCIVWAALKMIGFFRHESCGKCTPCREGTYWLTRVLQRMEAGQGDATDIDLLTDICDQMTGKCFCPLGDFATSPVASSIKHFRQEYEYHVRTGKCMV
ncbi:MAG: NADH-quinone oxidoreductase subunit NuoF [Anaerolineae bacterium]